ncbi:UDP-N-acetylglucosamine--LPS N-acetylglucosamine transferase [Marinobacterium mangrovicola]|uniref:Oligosaccharide biosynthesis protein Alg14 n=1 Tax=Marinobacterium mangrovicola TaxID=1476959 RepID=A0A4R1GHE0_9GAMM|nr:UDP-N-acetylglucosamine--LPS N-acetylglucosamine transferase [Marinobacterium mangrovicola]TCK07548.1 oligosaccharide biosynthesis protein Alg14 [Marinobacterium mangrovicola]
MKVLLISSSGGHWVQMSRVKPAFAGAEMIFASTEKHYGQHNPDHPFFYIPDASRSSPFRLAVQGGAVLWLILRQRPDCIVTTGATAGLWALVFGKKLGAKTIWLDSIANSLELSLCGKKAQKYADLYLTQWEHLATDRGPEYAGAVI